MSGHSSAPQPRRFRPQLESLEERAVPSAAPANPGVPLGPALLRAAGKGNRVTVDVSAAVRVTLAAPRHHGGNARVTATLTNVGTTRILKPICLVVRGLTRGVRLTNPRGVLTAFYPGSPFVARDINLAPGHSARYTLMFQDPKGLPFHFDTAVLGVRLMG